MHHLAGTLAFALWLPVPLHAAEPASAIQPANATTPQAGLGSRAADAEFVGHYYLSGIMETGSELLLKPDGRFQWYMTYGALDLTSEGRWRREGGHVILDPEITDGPPQMPELRFERMQLRIDGADLVPAWPWEDGAERGRYSRE